MDSCFPLGAAGLLTVKAGPDLLGLRVSTPELAEYFALVAGSPGLVVDVVATRRTVSIKETMARTGSGLCSTVTVLTKPPEHARPESSSGALDDSGGRALLVRSYGRSVRKDVPNAGCETSRRRQG